MNFKERSQTEITEAKIGPYTPEQLRSVFSEWNNKFIKSQTHSDSDETVDENIFNQLYDSHLRELIAKLIKEKEKFGHIFETEHGSVYFMLQSGESLRVKCSHGKFNEYSVNHVLKDIFFISESEQERLLDICKKSGRHHDGVLGVPIEIVSLSEGSCPVELNMYDSDRKFDTAIMKSGNKVKLVAPKFGWTQRFDFNEEDAQGQISNGIHIGHKITKVIR